jgi:ABC-2 type transport system permease protein
VQLTPAALLVLPIIVELFVFSISLAFILSALYVKFRDLGHIWDVFMQGAYFATPIFYPISMVLGFSETGGKLMMLSPMTQMIQDARYLMVTTQTETVWTLFGNPAIMVIPLVIVVVLALFSVYYFRRSSRFFAEEI